MLLLVLRRRWQASRCTVVRPCWEGKTCEAGREEAGLGASPHAPAGRAQAVAEVQRGQMFETYRAALGKVQASKRTKQRAAAAADFRVR